MATLEQALGASIRAERARRRWSQEDLGRRVGWSKQMVSLYELGRRRIAVNDLPRVCAAFDLPLSRLLDGADSDDLRALGL